MPPDQAVRYFFISEHSYGDQFYKLIFNMYALYQSYMYMDVSDLTEEKQEFIDYLSNNFQLGSQSIASGTCNLCEIIKNKKSIKCYWFFCC